MMDENRASSSEYDVSIKQRTCGTTDSISRQTSIPFPSGRRTSRMATSGSTSRISFSPSSAVPASPDHIHVPLALGSVRRPVRTSSWSSRTNTQSAYAQYATGAGTGLTDAGAPVGASPGLGDPAASILAGRAAVRPYRRSVRLRRLVQAILILMASCTGRWCSEGSSRRRATSSTDGTGRSVFDRTGGRSDTFVTVGLSDEEEQAIGPRPTGRGVLGTLISDEQAASAGQHADSPTTSGRPPSIPP